MSKHSAPHEARLREARDRRLFDNPPQLTRPPLSHEGLGPGPVRPGVAPIARVIGDEWPTRRALPLTGVLPQSHVIAEEWPMRPMSPRDRAALGPELLPPPGSRGMLPPVLADYFRRLLNGEQTAPPPGAVSRIAGDSWPSRGGGIY